MSDRSAREAQLLDNDYIDFDAFFGVGRAARHGRGRRARPSGAAPAERAASEAAQARGARGPQRKREPWD